MALANFTRRTGSHGSLRRRDVIGRMRQHVGHTDDPHPVAKPAVPGTLRHSPFLHVQRPISGKAKRQQVFRNDVAVGVASACLGTAFPFDVRLREGRAGGTYASKP